MATPPRRADPPDRAAPRSPGRLHRLRLPQPAHLHAGQRRRLAGRPGARGRSGCSRSASPRRPGTGPRPALARGTSGLRFVGLEDRHLPGPGAVLADEHRDAERGADLGPVAGHGLVEAQHQEPAAEQHPDLVVERAALRPEVPRPAGLAAEQGAVEERSPCTPIVRWCPGRRWSVHGGRVAARRLLDLAPRRGGEREGGVVVQVDLDDRVLSHQVGPSVSLKFERSSPTAVTSWPRPLARPRAAATPSQSTIWTPAADRPRHAVATGPGGPSGGARAPPPPRRTHAAGSARTPRRPRRARARGAQRSWPECRGVAGQIRGGSPRDHPFGGPSGPKGPTTARRGLAGRSPRRRRAAPRGPPRRSSGRTSPARTGGPRPSTPDGRRGARSGRARGRRCRTRRRAGRRAPRS